MAAATRALGELVPADAAFSHLSAARIWGLPMSYAMEADDALHVIRPIAWNRVRRPGVRGHRAEHVRPVEVVNGLRVVGLADTWVDLGELIGPGMPVGLDDCIVLGDAVAQRLGSVAPLSAALERRIRPRGKLTLLDALERIRVGSRSAGETVARLMLVRSGLPEPSLNSAIISEDGQRLLGVADLAWWLRRPGGRVVKVIGEYQGEEFHSSEPARMRDEERFALFRADGYVVQALWNDDLTTDEARHQAVLRFASALEIPRRTLSLADSAPRFFSDNMVALAQVRARRQPWSRAG